MTNGSLEGLAVVVFVSVNRGRRSVSGVVVSIALETGDRKFLQVEASAQMELAHLQLNRWADRWNDGTRRCV